MNDKSERVFMQFRSSVDGVRFWALQDRNVCFFMVISRWFVMHFGVILHDFVHPSGCLISVYEWSSEQLKTRNFHHFLKRFCTGKIPLPVTLVGFSEKWGKNLAAKKWSIFGPFVHRYRVFLLFHVTSQKTWYLWRFVSVSSIILGFSVHPKRIKSWRFLECKCVRRRAKWGQNRGAGTVLIFPYSAI